MNNKEEIKKIVKDLLENELKYLIGQFDILPDQVKSRHISEGVRYLRSGLDASKPTSGEKIGAVYFSYDTDTLYVWNGTSWVGEVLT